MLHTFPDDITRVTESTYFAMSFAALVFLALPLPQILICLIFNKSFSFHVAGKKMKQLDWFASGGYINQQRGHVLQ